MRVVIIGATGNVGTALLRRMKQAQREGRDLQITGVARRLPDRSREPYDGVDWHAFDVATDAGRDRLADVLRGADAVVHLAWVLHPNRNEAELYRVNVTGTANALAAAAEAGVGQFVCASSVGAYSPATKDRTVDEFWPARGIASSHYSRHKGEQEELLDQFEHDCPEIRVARLRPGLIFQRDAGSQIGRYFLGPLVPKFFLNKLRLPVLPVPDVFKFQAVHSGDIADAYWRVVDQRASGAFNIAADPVVTPQVLAEIFGARRTVNIPFGMVRTAIGIAWALHLEVSDPGWADMARNAPIMRTDRARRELGWEPRHTSVEAIREVLDGMSAGSGVPASPKLKPR